MGNKDPQEREEYEEPMLGIFHGLCSGARWIGMGGGVVVGGVVGGGGGGGGEGRRGSKLAW
jgi:hypothetical protein